MNTWLHVQNVQKKLDDFNLGPIDFAIEPGTITALIGSNGAGKSTFLKLLMHQVKQDTGSITMFDQPTDGRDESWKKHVAYQPQKTKGYDAFTGEALKDLISHWYPTWDEALFTSMVKHFNLSLTKNFGKMSQGAQQKLILALAIARNTRLLILDEPTAFLDILSKQVFMDVLIDWMEKEERAIIIASHQAEDIRKLADYITVMKNGKMGYTYEKEALIASYQRYWFRERLSFASIPGEVVRVDNSITSNNPNETEAYLRKHGLIWSHQAPLDLDEVITLLLTEKNDA